MSHTTAAESVPLTCTHCASPVGSGRFCTACGAPLQVETDDVLPGLEAATIPSPRPEVAPAPWLDAAAAPPARRSRPNGLALLVVGALLVSGWAIARGVEEHTLSGTVLLLDASTTDLDPGDGCSGDGGYSDLDAGAQVVVADEDGTTLSTGRLSSGEYDGLGCVFSFALEDVPRADFYGLTVAGEDRGELEYSYAELADDDWAVELVLGDD